MKIISVFFSNAVILLFIAGIYGCSTAPVVSSGPEPLYKAAPPPQGVTVVVEGSNSYNEGLNISRVATNLPLLRDYLLMKDIFDEVVVAEEVASLWAAQNSANELGVEGFVYFEPVGMDFNRGNVWNPFGKGEMTQGGGIVTIILKGGEQVYKETIALNTQLVNGSLMNESTIVTVLADNFAADIGNSKYQLISSSPSGVVSETKPLLSEVSAQDSPEVSAQDSPEVSAQDSPEVSTQAGALQKSGEALDKALGSVTSWVKGVLK